VLRLQIRDLGHQVAVLLNEQQRTAHGNYRRGAAQPSSLSAHTNGTSNGVLTAGDAITHHLLTFTNIQVPPPPHTKPHPVVS